MAVHVGKSPSAAMSKLDARAQLRSKGVDGRIWLTHGSIRDGERGELKGFPVGKQAKAG